MRGRRHFGTGVFLSSVKKTASPSYIESCNTKISFSAYKKIAGNPTAPPRTKSTSRPVPAGRHCVRRGFRRRRRRRRRWGRSAKPRVEVQKFSRAEEAGKYCRREGEKRGREAKKPELPFQQLRLYGLFGAHHATRTVSWGAAAKQPRGKKGRGRWGHMIRNGNKSGIYGQYILADFFWQASHPRRTRQASHLRGTAGAVVGRRGEKDRNGRRFLPPPAPQHKEDLGRKSHTTRLNSLPSPPFAKARSEKRTKEKGKRRTPLIFPAPFPRGSLALEGKRTRLRTTPDFDFGFKVRTPVGLAANEKEKSRSGRRIFAWRMLQ